MSPMTLDTYVVETLMPDLVGHDRQPSAFLVYLHLWSKTHGRARARVQISLVDLAEGTGLAKRSVQAALTTLVKRRLVSVERASITAVPHYAVYRPWRRSERP